MSKNTSENLLALGLKLKKNEGQKLSNACLSSAYFREWGHLNETQWSSILWQLTQCSLSERLDMEIHIAQSCKKLFCSSMLLSLEVPSNLPIGKGQSLKSLFESLKGRECSLREIRRNMERVKSEGLRGLDERYQSNPQYEQKKLTIYMGNPSLQQQQQQQQFPLLMQQQLQQLALAYQPPTQTGRSGSSSSSHEVPQDSQNTSLNSSNITVLPSPNTTSPVEANPVINNVIRMANVAQNVQQPLQPQQQQQQQVNITPPPTNVIEAAAPLKPQQQQQQEINVTPPLVSGPVLDMSKTTVFKENAIALPPPPNEGDLSKLPVPTENKASSESSWIKDLVDSPGEDVCYPGEDVCDSTTSGNSKSSSIPVRKSFSKPPKK